MQERKFNNYKLVIIRPIGRSGSIFLQSLFDSHPQILSFPMVFPFYLHWRIFSTLHNQTLDHLINYYVSETHLKYLFVKEMNLPLLITDRKGRKRSFTIDKTTFIRHLKKLIGRSGRSLPTRKEFLIALHLAYARTVGIPYKRRKIILLHEHGSYNYEDPNEDAEDVCNIVTTREPRNSYASFVGYRQRLGTAFAPFYNILDLNGWVDGFINAMVYAKRFPKKIYFVKTEELNSDPKGQIDTLVDIIGIRFHPTLLHSTYANLPLVLGFSSFNAEKKGFDAKGMNEDRWKVLCSKREIEIIDTIFRKEDIAFSYKRNISQRPLYKTIFTILKPDVQLLKLRYKNPRDVITYILCLHPLWIRLCFLRNLFVMRYAHGEKYKEVSLYRIRFFDIVLYKLKIKSLLGIRN